MNLSSRALQMDSSDLQNPSIFFKKSGFERVELGESLRFLQRPFFILAIIVLLFAVFNMNKLNMAKVIDLSNNLNKQRYQTIQLIVYTQDKIYHQMQD